MEAELVESGRFVRIETGSGERSRRRGDTGTGAAGGRSVTVGFVPVEDGSILVAATSPSARWAADLLDGAPCRVTIGEAAFDAVAEPLDGPDFARAIRELILRYGTPSETLGSGPAFRLRPR
jgi:hypothetical protein